MFQSYILLHRMKIIESTLSSFSRLRRSDFRSFSERDTIFTDLLADSVAVDDEEAAEEAPVDGGDVPLVCSEANANTIWKPAYKLLFCEDRP